jgi:hypothetical protein
MSYYRTGTGNLRGFKGRREPGCGWRFWQQPGHGINSVSLPEVLSDMGSAVDWLGVIKAAGLMALLAKPQLWVSPIVLNVH